MKMKKMILIALVLIALFAFVEIAHAEETCNDNSDSNSSLLVVGQNLTCIGNCTFKNTIVVNNTDNTGDIRNDLYGTANHSSPKDMILNSLENSSSPSVQSTQESPIKSICYDPALEQYFHTVSDQPPAEFIAYLKGLGYDDEAHIDTIWSICLQERLDSTQAYINNQSGIWSQDLVGGGVQQEDIVSIFQAAIEWLEGKGDSVYSQAKNLGMILDSYFANKRDVWILNNKINQLQMRVEALERTMETVAPEAYCKGKLDVMNEYNLTGVKCGANSTLYWNAKKAGFDNYDTIAYRTCDESWICTSWSDCINGIQSRKCVDKNDCGSFDNKPLEYRNCIVEQKEVKSTVAEKPKVEAPTKQVLSNNYLSKNNLSILIVAVAVVSLALGFYNPKNEKLINKQ